MKSSVASNETESKTTMLSNRSRQTFCQKMIKLSLILSLVLSLLCSFVPLASAQTEMNSDSYQIQFGNFNTTAGEKSSDSYTMTDTVGQVGPGDYGSGLLKAGFQYIYPFDNLLDQIGNAAEDLAPIGSALVSSVVPVAATIAVASQFGWGLSLQILIKVLQALGLLPPPAPQGLVYDIETQKGVPFAVININKKGELSVTETVVTNTQGVYGGVSLPSGSYQLDVRHQDYRFPTAQSRPSYLTMSEFYKGEVFSVEKASSQQLFIIPVDPLVDEVKKGFSFSGAVMRERFVRFLQYLIYPLFILSVIIMIAFPTVINKIIVGIYVLIFLSKLVGVIKRPRITGKITNEASEPLENVYVRIFDQESNQLMALLLTNKKGEFKAFLPPKIYQISLLKQKYIWLDNGEVLNSYVADTRTQRHRLLAVMQDSQKLVQNLFK